MEENYYNAEQDQLYDRQAEDHKSAVSSWQDSEFIYHHKSPAWFAAIVGAALTLCIILFLIIGLDIFAFVVIAIISTALIVIGNRKPRTINYSLFSDGVQISDSFHSFNNFRSFSVIEEAGHIGLELLPTGKLQFPTTILFGVGEVEKIMPIIVNNLPMVEKPHTVIDRLVNQFKL